MTLSREEKLKILNGLPSDLQEMIFSDNTVVIVDKICKKYNLSEEKSAILVSLISDILFGNISIEKLSIILKEKLEIDEQSIVNISSDLTTELFLKVKASLQKIRPPEKTVLSSLNLNTIIPTPTPAPIPVPAAPSQIPSITSADRYREPTNGGPEIVDLRKMPPSPIQAPVAAAPIPPLPKPISPLTFTKPIEPIKPPLQAPVPTNLIEAEPHKVVPPPTPPQPSQISPRETLEGKPQFIIRPPGLAPTPTPMVGAPTPANRGVGADLPHDVLDLRKDKGEF